MEERALNTDRFSLLNDQAQFPFIWNMQHDEVTANLRLKVAPGLKTGMADLHDLIGQGQIGANQGVDMARRILLLWHGKHPIG